MSVLTFIAVAIVSRHTSQQLLVRFMAATELRDECGSFLTAEFHDGSAASANEEDS